MPLQIAVDQSRIVDFCRRHHIRRLAFFGSVLRADFRQDSDVDVLVEYEPRASVSLLDMAEQQEALSTLLGRRADLRTPRDLSRYFREEVVAGAEVQYVAP